MFEEKSKPFLKLNHEQIEKQSARIAVTAGARSRGRTRANVQRYRCQGCQKTFCGRTTSGIRHIHRPDLFLEVIRDMLGIRAPSSIRQLANRLGLDKHTIWRWRLIIMQGLSDSSDDQFSGIVEVDETYQKESRKGSREWVR